MILYVVRRLLLVLPTLFLLGTLVFFLSRMVPGDPADAIVGQTSLSSGDRDKLRDELGLNEPLPSAYANWWADMLRGDLGSSVITHLSISDQVKSRLPVSLELGLMATFFAVIIGVPIGILSAVRQDSWPDYILRSTSVAFLSIPGFWIAILVIGIGSAEFKWAPNFQYVKFIDDPWENLKQFALPAAIIGLATSASIMRMMRATLLDVVRQDYVRTARAKGLRERTIISRHSFRNALIPVITSIGLGLATIIGGSVIFEQIFNLPGMGVYVLDAIQRRDYPVIQAVNLIIATFIILTNLLIDISYAYIDPRIRYS